MLLLRDNIHAAVVNARVCLSEQVDSEMREMEREGM